MHMQHVTLAIRLSAAIHILEWRKAVTVWAGQLQAFAMCRSRGSPCFKRANRRPATKLVYNLHSARHSVKGKFCIKRVRNTCSIKASTRAKDASPKMTVKTANTWLARPVSGSGKSCPNTHVMTCTRTVNRFESMYLHTHTGVIVDNCRLDPSSVWVHRVTNTLMPRKARKTDPTEHCNVTAHQQPVKMGHILGRVASHHYKLAIY